MSEAHVAIQGNQLTVTIDLATSLPELTRCREAAETASRHWEESEWYLGEARATIARLHEDLAAVGEAYHHLQEQNRALADELEQARQQRDEANWYLTETRAAQDDLRRQTAELTGQLLRAEDTIDAAVRAAQEADGRVQMERARRKALEAQLAAVRAHGERRYTSRIDRPDVRVELQDPDGTLLFQGAPRNVSSTGLGIASDNPIEQLPDLLQVRLHFAGLDHPIEAIGRPTWQARNGSYLMGCQLLDVPSGCLDTLERALGSEAQ
jgi:hypothetical protein